MSLARGKTGLAEPETVLLHALLLLGGRPATAGSMVRRAGGRTPSPLHAVVGVVSDFELRHALVDLGQAQPPGAAVAAGVGDEVLPDALGMKPLNPRSGGRRVLAPYHVELRM